MRTTGQKVPDGELWPSEAIEELGDLARLIEAHPALEAALPADASQANSR